MGQELIRLDLGDHVKIKLVNAIDNAMIAKNIDSMDPLDLGFNLPAQWPFMDNEPTLEQLVVFSKKLNMRVRITHLELIAMPNDSAAENSVVDKDGKHLCDDIGCLDVAFVEVEEYGERKLKCRKHFDELCIKRESYRKV